MINLKKLLSSLHLQLKNSNFSWKVIKLVDFKCLLEKLLIFLLFNLVKWSR